MTVLISVRAKDFPAQFAGPYENGMKASLVVKNLGTWLSFPPFEDASHLSGMNASGSGEKYRGSR